MSKYDSIIIGHVCMDTNTDCEGNVEKRCGGAVLYSSAAAHALGHKVLAVTKLREEDKAWLASFNLPKEDVIAIGATSSTVMQNTYFTPDKERRLSICAVRGEAFSLKDIPEADGAIYHFAGLTVGDFDEALLMELSKKGAVAVDVQGFLRKVQADGTMRLEDWANKKQCLPYVTYLKTDAAEAEVLTGLSDRAAAAKLLYEWGAKEVLITHNSQVLVYDGKHLYTCPIKSRNFVGRTGRGDTTFAAYVNERLTGDVPTALLYATATVSLKMEKTGVFTGTRREVDNYIQLFYNEGVSVAEY